jgi:hypothetical protein
MRPIKSVLFILTILASSLGHAQFTDVINSNRPGESMAAFSVGKTVIQAELGAYFIDEKHSGLNYQATGFGSDLSVRYGAFLEQLEFIMELQYQYDNYKSPTEDYNRSGLRQSTFGAKFLIYDPNKNYEKKPNLYSWKANHKFEWHDFIPAVGIYGGFNLTIGNNPFAHPSEENFSPKAMLLTQNQFGKYVFVTNFIVDKVATNFQNYGYILTLTRGFNARWSGFIENQGYKGDYYDDLVVRLGAAYLIKENVQIDASIGKNLKDTPSILTAGFGISWRFDENYNEVILRAPKDEKDKDKDKKKKEKKDKAKKRVDGVEGEGEQKP